MSNKQLDNERMSLWLDSFASITLKQKFQLIEFYGTPISVFENLESDKNYIASVVGESTLNKMMLGASETYIDDLVSDLEKQGIKFISYFSPDYSNLLKTIKNPPLLLYYKGDVKLLNTMCIGMVGTRHCTHYGADCARKIAHELAENGITIVSGLATGIDTCSHEGALMGGKTISVFAGGVDVVYPNSNTNLANTIAEQGLIIAEHRPHTPTTSYNFPLRSRIIAGLSRGVLIVESAVKGGTMYAKDYALSENRDVFAVPGNITSSASAGTNLLIQKQEAYMVLDAKDILAYYSITAKIKEDKKSAPVGGIEEEILKALEIEGQYFESLREKLAIDAKTLMQTLTKMEIKGMVVKRAGNLYDLKK